MQRKRLEHFCKYRHICEFLGNEGKEKEEIKKYLMQELGLPEATAQYQMRRALEDDLLRYRYVRIFRYRSVQGKRASC